MEPEDDKLYVKILCSVCCGMSRGCPYCDEQGNHYIEASDKRVVEWLKEQKEEDKMKFRTMLEEV